MHTAFIDKYPRIINKERNFYQDYIELYTFVDMTDYAGPWDYVKNL